MLARSASARAASVWSGSGHTASSASAAARADSGRLAGGGGLAGSAAGQRMHPHRTGPSLLIENSQAVPVQQQHRGPCLRGR